MTIWFLTYRRITVSDEKGIGVEDQTNDGWIKMKDNMHRNVVTTEMTCAEEEDATMIMIPTYYKLYSGKIQHARYYRAFKCLQTHEDF